ncbi:hypothetical protein SteCoe_20443 [Stentor coeruleus]|uniref:Uncharacterized protein n=1 Tax=Stentor coeruleus TaxID=5963 RepID=A0A1R2BS83_9CILI|nr:hypothetical protein SteCoe_20443 [Stentor coeruleus]
MEPIFEKPIYSNNSIKGKLIDNFFRSHSISFIGKIENSSKIQDQPKPEKPEILCHSSSSQSLTIIRVGHKSPPRSRPSSVCSAQSTNTLASNFYDPTISSVFTMAIKNINIKKVQYLQKATRDENSQYLVNAFLILLAQNETNVDFSTGLKIMKTSVWGIFERYLYKPGFFIQIIRAMPKLIKRKKIPENDVRRALGLFNMVEIDKIGVYYSLYTFVKECFNYINECYNLPIVFKQKNSENKPRRLKRRGDKSSRVQSELYDQIENCSEVETNIKPIEKIPINRPSSVLAENSSGNLQDQPINQISNAKIFYEEQDKKSSHHYKNLSVPQDHKPINAKAQQFFINSRINKRIHDKFISFLQEKSTLTFCEGVPKEQLTQKLIENFIKTLPCSEMSGGTIKFIDYFSHTKEFERLKNHLT